MRVELASGSSREVSVPEAAALAGVSDVRIRQLAKQGRLRARQSGRMWFIDPSSVPLPRERGRPLVPKIAWGALRLASSLDAPWLNDAQVSAAWAAIRRIVEAEDPALRARSLLAGRADRLALHAVEPEGVLDDPRVIASGVSVEAGGIMSRSVEGYVKAADMDRLARRHGLQDAPAGEANVVVHVAPMLPAPGMEYVVAAADLAESFYPRERAQAAELWRAVRLP